MKPSIVEFLMSVSATICICISTSQLPLWREALTLLSRIAPDSIECRTVLRCTWQKSAVAGTMVVAGLDDDDDDDESNDSDMHNILTW